MESTIVVRKYEIKDHNDVRKIFGNGVTEHVMNGIKVSLKDASVLAKLIFIFILGSYFGSIKHGLIAISAMVSLLCFFVFIGYNMYARDHLSTDMKDPELKFWTTEPNIFLVAALDSGKVIGCISYQKISPDTVEMHRLSVDSNYRGLGVGKKLVLALSEKAKEYGFKTMYLETSNAQLDAIRLYNNIGFQFVGQQKIEYWILDHITGLKVFGFSKELQ